MASGFARPATGPALQRALQLCGGAQAGTSQRRPYERISSITGISAFPLSVSAYSTRGGTSG